MPGLQAERGGHRRKARIERHQLDFDPDFLLLVGKGLPHAERGRIGGICEANLVVPVVGGAGPEPDRIDRRRVRPIFAFGGDFGLMRVDAGLVIGAIDAGDVVQRVVLRDCRADKPAIENIRAADRGAVRPRRRIRLPAVERLGGIEQIWIARDLIIAGVAAIGVGVKREIATAGIKKHAAFNTAIDGADSRSRLRGHASRRLHACEWRLDR